MNRRNFLHQTSQVAFTGLALSSLVSPVAAKPKSDSSLKVQTVLGPIDPQNLGVTLMHEHAPVVDWSELYEAPTASITKEMYPTTARLLEAFHKTLKKGEGPGAIVECTPIRVGRYPHVLMELAKQTPVHIIACTGFWCEAFAPQHPWAVRLGLGKEGIKKIANLYIREITEGMEDPSGEWGEKFSKVKVGIIKCATSKFLRPSERRCHEAAAIANKETGCPITTHTTDGGGLEEASLFVKKGAKPEKVIIGHQGNLDDRTTEEAHEYHRQIAALGCNIQFDRVGHEKYEVDKIARQVKMLIDSGHVKQILVGHDHVPYFYEDYTAETKNPDSWLAKKSDYTIVTTSFVEAMKTKSISKQDIHTILVENPQRILAF